MCRTLPALLLLLSPSWLVAQPVVVSPSAEGVSVTVYRGEGGELDSDWPEGYALVTETRTVDLPQGSSEIRFEGVAGGIVPVSAIVRGLPERIAEKNRDARLISPGGLIDATLGKRVHIRRTSHATGQVTETEAVVRSGPGGVILQTSEGIEALRCTGLPETLVYDALPEGLSDKPTLSIRTSAPAATRATLRLSYLATGFDWRANYVINMAPDGRTLDLFAWLTLANGNDESFAAAQTQAVAGSPNKEDEGELAESDVPEEIRLQCWPSGTTSDVPFIPPPPPPASERDDYSMSEEIIVTARRREEKMAGVPASVMMAQQEELGDLKLYRIPEPVTVAANAQKQVALLTKPDVRFERLYGADLTVDGEEEDPEPVAILLRMKNEKKSGLGVPLPSGAATIFETVEGRPMMAGEAGIEDTAVGQELELRVGESPQVRIAQRLVSEVKDKQGVVRGQRFEVEITNANPFPVTVETLLRMYGDWRLIRPTDKLVQRNGRQMWRAKVPANGRSRLIYGLQRIDPPIVKEDEEEEE